MMSLHMLRCCCGLCVRTGVALSACVPAWVCNMCCDFCYALASVVVVLAVSGVHRCCIVAVRSLLCCGCLFHVALCVYVSTLSGDVLVVGVRSSRCFAVLFPLCVRSLFWFVLCAVSLCGESAGLCVLFVVCGRGCSWISQQHEYQHHHHHHHVTRGPSRSRGRGWWNLRAMTVSALYLCICTAKRQ